MILGSVPTFEVNCSAKATIAIQGGQHWRCSLDMKHFFVKISSKSNQPWYQNAKMPKVGAAKFTTFEWKKVFEKNTKFAAALVAPNDVMEIDLAGSSQQNWIPNEKKKSVIWRPSPMQQNALRLATMSRTLLLKFRDVQPQKCLEQKVSFLLSQSLHMFNL